MGEPLNVPWDKIRAAVEKGTGLRDVANLFGIKYDTVRIRSNREKWDTPKRIARRLNSLEKIHEDKVAGSQSCRDQLIRVGETSAAAIKPKGSATQQLVDTTPKDVGELAADYQKMAAEKLHRIITQTVIAPPRNWKDFDIADKMMRRTLGLDNNDGKAATVVQLQVVNERLRQVETVEDIVEGDLVGESVPDPSPESLPPCENTGL